MRLVPINQFMEENTPLAAFPECAEMLGASVDFYKMAGFNPPWICYYAEENGLLVGSAAFKGMPRNGQIEIAYGTFPHHQSRGVGTRICRRLVELALTTNPTLNITARTLPDNSFSSRILQKNNFQYAGTILDEEDGVVCEWMLLNGRV